MAISDEFTNDVIEHQRYFGNQEEDALQEGYGDDEEPVRPRRTIRPAPEAAREQPTLFINGDLDPRAVLNDKDYAEYIAQRDVRERRVEFPNERPRPQPAVESEPGIVEYYSPNPRDMDPVDGARIPVPPKPRPRRGGGGLHPDTGSNTPARPQGPGSRSGRGASNGEVPDGGKRGAPRTRFQSAIDAEPDPEVQAKIRALKDKFGYEQDDYVWSTVESLGIAQRFYGDVPDRFRDAADELVALLKQEVAIAASELNEEAIVQRVSGGVVDEVNRGIQETVVPRIFGKQIDLRMRWVAAGAALSAVITAVGFVVGILAGSAISYNHYELRYEARLAELPHLTNTINTQTGRSVLDLIEKNPEDALLAIVQCRSAAGLISVKSKTGEKICTGSSGAKVGWRIP